MAQHGFSVSYILSMFPNTVTNCLQAFCNMKQMDLGERHAPGYFEDQYLGRA